MRAARACEAVVGIFTSCARLPRLTVARGPQEMLPGEESADPQSPGSLCAPSSEARLRRGRLQGQADGALAAGRDRERQLHDLGGAICLGAGGGGAPVGAGSPASPASGADVRMPAAR